MPLLVGACFLLVLSSCKWFTPKYPEVSIQLAPVFAKYDSLMNREDFAKALVELENGIANQPLTNYDKLSYYQAKAGYAFDVEADFGTTKIYLDSFSQLMNQFSNLNPEKLAFYYIKSGGVANSEGKFEDAFLYFYKCKLLLDDNNGFKNSQNYTSSIASVLFKDGNYLAAANYFKESYEIGERSSDTIDFQHYLGLKQVALNNAAVSFETLGMLDSALVYYNKALTLINKSFAHYPDRENYLQRAKGIVLGNIGGIYLKQKKYDLAQPLLEESIRINYREGFEISDAILTKIKLATFCLETNNMTRCLALIKELNPLVDSMPNPKAKMRLADLNYRVSKQNKKYDEAIKYDELRDAWSDSLHNKYRRNYSNDNYLHYFEQAKKQVDYELLERSNQLKNIYLGVACFIVLVGIGLVIFSLNKRKKQRQYIDSLHEMNELVNVTNKRLQQSLNSLEKSQEENQRMTKIIAHDLRSPVSSIMGLLRLLKIDETPKVELHEYLDLAEQSGQKALDLIAEVLKENIQKQGIDKGVINIAELLDSCIQMNQLTTIEKGIQVRAKIEPFWVEANEGNLWRVFSNLMSNAIKFSNPNTEILVYTQSDKNSVTIAFQDHGIGIPVDIQSNVFDMFTNAGRKGTNGEESNGLGLAISKQIVEAHNGSIWFTTEENKGTTFFVRLPIANKAV